MGMMATETEENYRKQPIRVGFYDIERTIGKGNFAVVKLAKHRVTKSTVAIKIIDKSRLDDKNLVKIRREVKIMKSLRHPHVLKVYQVMETQNMLYIVTEYATNGEMFAHIDKTGRLSEEEACRIFSQILSAVDYCHKKHVVHRDLKTENVLLDENLNVRIADFGFGNYFQRDKCLNSWCGSPPYAAPEIFEGREYVGPEVDIWSLGVILYVLVCAALPFDGSTFTEVRDHVLSGRFRVPYFMSSELEDLIRKILVKNTTQRYTIDQIKNHPWMQQGSFSDNELLRNQSNDFNSEKGIDGDLNLQVLSLMKGLQIDTETTKKSVKENAFNHYCAIYFLLAERLKQHRSSYPEQKRYGTRLRRASVMADQVIIKNGSVQSVVHSKSPDMMQPIPRQIPVTPLQYALTDLHIGDVKIPNDMRPKIPGCAQEFVPHAVGTPAQHIVSRCSPSFLSDGHTPTIQEDVAGEDSGESTSVNPSTGYSANPKRRVRRTAILPTTTVNPSQETLFVPANHPLLRMNNADNAGSNHEIKNEMESSYLPNGMKIKIVPPTEQLSNSLATVSKTKTETRLHGLRHTLLPAFNEGRRASEGNPSNAPFCQVLHNAEIPALRKEQNELLKLQQNYQRSVTPEEIYQQQMDHVAYRDVCQTERLNIQPSFERFPAECSFITEEMEMLPSCFLQRLSDETEDSDMMLLNSSVPGPYRRQHSCRKLSNSPINISQRTCSKRHRKQSILTDKDAFSPDFLS